MCRPREPFRALLLVLALALLFGCRSRPSTPAGPPSVRLDAGDGEIREWTRAVECWGGHSGSQDGYRPVEEISARWNLFALRFGIEARSRQPWVDLQAAAGITLDRLDDVAERRESAARGYEVWRQCERTLLLEILGRDDEAAAILFDENRIACAGCCYRAAEQDGSVLARVRGAFRLRHGDARSAVLCLLEGELDQDRSESVAGLSLLGLALALSADGREEEAVLLLQCAVSRATSGPVAEIATNELKRRGRAADADTFLYRAPLWSLLTGSWMEREGAIVVGRTCDPASLELLFVRVRLGTDPDEPLARLGPGDDLGRARDALQRHFERDDRFVRASAVVALQALGAARDPDGDGRRERFRPLTR